MQFTDFPPINFLIATFSGAPFAVYGSVAGMISTFVQFFTGLLPK